MAITITLPDGTKREFDAPLSGFHIARSIASSLAKKALAVTIDGVLHDLDTEIAKDASISVVTAKDPMALDLLRHDCAHIMAEAVQRLFPETRVAFGPSIENGFYYDFHSDHTFTPDDFPLIEKEMRNIVSANAMFRREEWNREEAVKWFIEKGESLKAEHIGDIPEGQALSIYRQGDWLDLCRGPHSPSTGCVGKAFKILKIAGAHWKGDVKGIQLQRIYATCWHKQDQLDAYLHMIAEAEKRDHRRLGRQMDLFHFHEEAMGSIFWHEKGWKIFLECEHYMRYRLEKSGYMEVKTPQLLNRALWERSGHWEKFRDNMLVMEEEKDHFMALKPMNCPGHVHIFNQGIKSYRDLPVRISEFGQVHRNEASGALLGLMRVRAFTQDDGHIFCRDTQIIDETIIFCDLLRQVYHDFGFDDISVKFSTRPELRAGSDEVWDKSEVALREATESAGLPYTLNPGEGAFYGPKLEFILRDAIGRDWQCGTLQVDFVLPERLDAQYIAEDNRKYRPVMLHRTIFGSLERFIGILIENYAGRMPYWLAPTQLVLATITNDFDSYAEGLVPVFEKAGLRVCKDTRNEKIGYKIREHSEQKVPIIAVLGKKEQEDNTVTLRYLGEKKQETLAVFDAVGMLSEKANPFGIKK